MNTHQCSVVHPERLTRTPDGDGATRILQCSNPFDARTSDRELFPSFEAALADKSLTEESEQKDAKSALDWSIDTLAELKPIAFSPLSQQKTATNATKSPSWTSKFFEDEKQYDVLRTPLPAARAARAITPAAANRTTLILTPSPLHRRCNESIAPWQVTSRERQVFRSLQGSTRSPRRRSVHQRAAMPSRSTLPRKIKRNRSSVTNKVHNAWPSPDTRPPKWSASPIGWVGTRHQLCATPATPHVDLLTSSPLVHSCQMTTPKQRSKVRLSFDLSPIAFPIPEVEEQIECEDAMSSKLTDATLQLSCRALVSVKEPGHEMCGLTTKKDFPQPRTSLAWRRQQAFMEAMEAEACCRERELSCSF